MIAVAGLVALIWLGGWLLGWSAARRWGGTALVLALVLAAHGVLPTDHPLPRAIGGSFAGWATLAGALALALAYGAGVAALRARARPAPESTQVQAPAPTGPFSDDELTRYARHIVLREVGGSGQKALKEARVLVVGAGGLGAPALLYLAAAGVGRIGVVDDDEVSLSNLQRQVIYTEDDLGAQKAEAVVFQMRALNPHVTVTPHATRLGEDNAAALLAGYDLVLEGSDNFATRYLVNRVAAGLKIPVIGGAISQWEGQVSTWDPGSGAPCYQCVFPEAPAEGLAPTCAEAGVMGPLPGVIGSMMALEAVKEITGAGDGLRGRLVIFDGLYGESRVVKTKRRAECPVCGGEHG